jgi:protease IV
MRWVAFGVRWVVWLLGSLRWRVRRPPAFVRVLLEGPLPELPPPRGPFWRRFLSPAPPSSMRDLTARLRRLAADRRVRGVVVHLRPSPYSASQVEQLTALVRELRSAGKRVVCWAPDYSAATYQIACAADEVLLQPGGRVDGLGLAQPYLYLKDALATVGVEADIVKIAPHKTAGDTLSRGTMSPEAREMADWLADAHLAERVAAIASGRSLTDEAARALIDASPYTDHEAHQGGVIDGVCNEEELAVRLGGRPATWQEARRRLRVLPPHRPGRHVAVLRIDGMIVDGRSRRPPVAPPLPVPLLFGAQTGDLSVAEEARRLARDRRVAAVVVWVDSPGGSASASEAIAAALTELAEKKPLVAAMGAVAASGGYYVTTPCRRVFAQAGTTTGSIGVLTGKLVAGQLFNRLHFHQEVISRGAHAEMGLPSRGYTDEERARVQALIERSYELFLARVSGGRGRTVAEIEPIAGGRVWTGRQAHERGLVDELGGLDRAAAEARRLGGLRPEAALRELSRRGELPTARPDGLAALGHAIAALRALDRAGAWLLCPLLSPPD